MKTLPTIVVPVIFAILVSCALPDEYNPLLEPRSMPVLGLEVIMPAARIIEAEAVRAEAWLILSDGTKSPADGTVWESLTADVLSVDGDGLVSGRAPGHGTIRALHGGLSATGELEVERRVDYGRILIGEVFYDAAGSDEGKEFIELYNGNEYPCDLSGMVVVDGSASSSTFTLPAGTALPAGGRVVIASSREGFFALFGAHPDLAGFSFSLNNGGETVRLMKKDGSPVDTVYIAGGTADFPAPAGWCVTALPAAASGESLHRAAGDHMPGPAPTGRTARRRPVDNKKYRVNPR